MVNLEKHRPESPELWRSFVLRYGCAVVSVAFAIWARPLLDPVADDHSRYAISLLAVLVTAWYGGGRPGLTALILGMLSTDYFLITPRGEFGHKGAEGYIELALYACVGLGTALTCGFMRSSSPEDCSSTPTNTKGPRAIRGSLRPRASCFGDLRLELGYQDKYRQGR